VSRRAAVLAALVLLAALPASAQAGLKAMWGPNELPDGRSAFPVYKSLGVDVLQYQVVWGKVADDKPARPRDPDDPAYRWNPAVDAAVAAARRSGIKVALMVKDTPNWAKGGRPGSLPPDRDRDYTDFLIAVAKRYPRVRHWMIWGEPSRNYNWSPFPKHSPQAPRRYATLLDRSYGTLKKRNRRNVVIGGMTFTTGDVYAHEWLRWMRLPNGKPPRLDWYGHNAFSVRRPSLAKRVYSKGVRDFSDLDTLRREVNRAYRKRKRRPKLWVSEFAVSSDRANRAFGFYVSREEQAAYVRDAYRIARRNKWIAGVGWYGLYDEPDPENGITTGLLTADGQRKPAYAAYKRAR
jgi:hypothetical protein